MSDTTRATSDRRFRPAFTLLELLAVAAILGIIAWIVVPRLSTNAFDSKRNTCYVIKGEVEVQAELWYRAMGTWPSPDLSDIGSDSNFFPEGLPVCPVDGTEYRLDATTHRVIGHQHTSP